MPSWSRRVTRTLAWAGPDDPGALAFLIAAAERHDLAGFLLVAASDADVRFVSRNATLLAGHFRLTLPEWETLRVLCEKPRLYGQAEALGLGYPRVWRADGRDAAAIRFPVVMKPAMGGGRSRLARAKVIRIDDAATLAALFAEASGEMNADDIVVQELIPGGGESQYSYAGLWRDGVPVAEFTARRLRQYPIDFGYTSTCVETVDAPDVAAAARRLLAATRHHGLIEVEFKRDPEGRLRLLDANPRPWSWFGLAAAAGLDLGALLAADAAPAPGRPVATARTGVAWIYLARDLAAALRLVGRGALGPRAYLRSLGRVRAFAAFAADDPLPGLVDLPLTAWRVLVRRVLKLR
nr:ATP-grasp domain-containing protein [Prosthecomicrobium pneumaticum]